MTTDKITAATTAVDDVTVDPNNHNTVYAATGDISFGSFAFGSAGILKSTDAGATWQALATSTFAPVYPPSTGGTYPQYQAVTKIRVDPNDSNKLVAGTKTGLFFSYDAGVNWSGACKTNNFSSQRQDITDLILRDTGSTTKVFAAVGARGFATTVQQNLGKNGANGVYVLNSMPASGCPAVSSWTALTSGWPAGTASGVACNPPIGDMTTTCAPNANKLGRIEMAIAPSNPNVMYAEVQSIDPQPACGALQVLGETTSRAASSASGAPPTEERPGPRSRATRPSASSRVRRRPARAVRTRRRCGTTWASPSIRTIRTPSSWTRSTSGSRPTAARHSPTSAAATTAG